MKTEFHRTHLSTAHLLRAVAFGLVTLWCTASAWSQTCSVPGQLGSATINAQPNTFFPATAGAAAGVNAITLGASTGAATPIAPGDLLLVIQMQGDDINSTDTNAYGDGVANAGIVNTVDFGLAGYAGGINPTNFVAGTYEYAVATTAVGTGGGTVGLSRGLSNSFFSRPGNVTTGKQAFQVIRVPQYANLTLSANLTVQAWDGSTGGVIALDAAGTLNMGGFTIDGNGRGFRGGGGINQGFQDPNVFTVLYRDVIANQFGAAKGEGLAGTPGRVYNGDFTNAGNGTVAIAPDGYPGGDLMRGAPGNAGGGGNQHNGGGGGGGNGGAGGRGGNTWNASQTNNVGAIRGGFGGAPSQNAAARLIMGGGGGAGDFNDANGIFSSGGMGGALVILRASQIAGNGTINVNGSNGLSNGGKTDGAGGAGAGGTVLIAAGAGGATGALRVNANGGVGGAYTAGGLEQDGAGGGGGGGVLFTNVTIAAYSATAGAAGTSSSDNCPPTAAAADCGQRPGFAGPGIAGYVITSPGAQVGYECLPNLTVTKATSTPLVTTTAGAIANYTVNVSNSGGGARFVSLQDLNLPPGWTLAGVPTYTYNPVQPLAAGRLSSGAETIAISTASPWNVGATPLAVPAAGANALTWNYFAVAPINNGVPGAVTVSFTVNIPDTAPVGTYHNGAGVSFLDPTRAAGATRVLSPATNLTANRTGTAYAAVSNYDNYNGSGGTLAAGSNYSGLQGGPAAEDVTLAPDFSVTKTAPAASTPGLTFTYTLTPRNNGRAIGAQVYATSQATDVAIANVPTTLGSNPLTVTDTMPSGVAFVTPFAGAGWTCTGTTVVVCTLANASAYPVAAATNFPPITATVTSNQRCPSVTTQTNSAAVSNGASEPVASQANNVGTATTAFTCASANLSVTKTNGVTNLKSGQTTTYTINVANGGPGDAPGTVVRDPATAGLSCSAATCSVGAGAAVCPATSIGALQGAGITIATFPANSSLNFAVTCTVTASGM